MSKNPDCPTCGEFLKNIDDETRAAMSLLDEHTWICGNQECDESGAAMTQNQLNNIRDAACEARDEQRAADGNQFFTALPYHTESDDRSCE